MGGHLLHRRRTGRVPPHLAIVSHRYSNSCRGPRHRRAIDLPRASSDAREEDLRRALDMAIGPELAHARESIRTTGDAVDRLRGEAQFR
jgi:hypothetical protein